MPQDIGPIATSVHSSKTVMNYAFLLDMPRHSHVHGKLSCATTYYITAIDFRGLSQQYSTALQLACPFSCSYFLTQARYRNRTSSQDIQCLKIGRKQSSRQNAILFASQDIPAFLLRPSNHSGMTVDHSLDWRYLSLSCLGVHRHLSTLAPCRDVVNPCLAPHSFLVATQGAFQGA